MRRSFPRRVAALAAGFAVLAALAACGGGGGGVARPPSSLGLAVSFTVPAAIRNIPLTKPDGSTTTLAAYQGKAVMIADYLSLCTDICPMISANTTALARALNADGQQAKVALLEISVDPQRDTPARTTAYQKLYGGGLPDWTLLTASPADTATLWKYFGVFYKRVKEPKVASIDWFTHKPLTYDVAHADDLIFLDASGRERFVVNAEPNVQGALPPRRLVRPLTAEGMKALRRPNPVDSWTVAQGLSVFSWLLNTRLSVPT